MEPNNQSYHAMAMQKTRKYQDSLWYLSPSYRSTSFDEDGGVDIDYHNNSLTNVFDNETIYENSSLEYDYDYDDALGTFYWGQLIPPLVVYSVTYVIGVVGNVLILFTIARYRRLKTTTNVFLASLATADLLLVLICIPVKLARLFSYTWTLGEIPCKAVYYLQSLSAMSSVLTLCAMSIERYYAIVYPMRAQYRCTISRAQRICSGIWLVSLFLASPTAVAQVHMEVGERVRAYWCVRDFDSPWLWKAYETYMLVVVLVVPAFVMAVAYTVISSAIIRMVAHRRTITGKGQMENGVLLLNSISTSRYKEGEESEVRQVISMLVVIVVLFVVCWGPILIINVLKSYGVLPAYSLILKHVATAVDLLSYCNSCVNPVVYGFMSRNFRESFCQVLCCSSRFYHGRVHRQMSLSVTRTSMMRHNHENRLWTSRSHSSRVSCPLTYSYNCSRSITNGSMTVETNPM